MPAPVQLLFYLVHAAIEFCILSLPCNDPHFSTRTLEIHDLFLRHPESRAPNSIFKNSGPPFLKHADIFIHDSFYILSLHRLR